MSSTLLLKASQDISQQAQTAAVGLERYGRCADIEEGLKELVDGEEAPRPVRWNQPLMVIISCAIILGILATGIGLAVRWLNFPCTLRLQQQHMHIDKAARFSDRQSL